MRTILTAILSLALASTADAQGDSPSENGTDDDQVWFIVSDAGASESLVEFQNEMPADRWSYIPAVPELRDVAKGAGIFADELRDFLETLTPILESASSTQGEYALDQFELTVSLTAEGKLGIVATATVSGATGIRLVFRRRQ